MRKCGKRERVSMTRMANRRLDPAAQLSRPWMFTPFYQSDSVFLPILRDRLVASIARIPPAPQFLAAMVAGTVIDPFAKAGLAEFDWMSAMGALPGRIELAPA